MGADERLPRVAPLPRRGRIDTLLLEDTLDRVPPQFVAYVLERSTQSRIAPTRVLPSHPHQQADDAGHGARSPRPAFGAAIVLLRHQFAVPTQDRIRRRHRGNLINSPASELPPQHRQSSPILIARNRTGSGVSPLGLTAAPSTSATSAIPACKGFTRSVPTWRLSHSRLARISAQDGLTLNVHSWVGN